MKLTDKQRVKLRVTLAQKVRLLVDDDDHDDHDDDIVALVLAVSSLVITAHLPRSLNFSARSVQPSAEATSRSSRRLAAVPLARYVS
jgi:hypothetical protein